ncbi:dihydropyrimidinase-related protein 3-A [Clonorchis sinensis]|uniref:dihydropyrimidinase n=1 Tax=Clonorchis sinensis TaxID=79923 RepID=G7YFQ5_CLOSI|nr:dihydropyrimidinase-related protein 3-A [Clonorchis sinensis]
MRFPPKNSTLRSIGKKLDVPRGIGTIDASGLLILPGGVDIATYIQNDMFDYREEDYTNTTKEAVLGGTTTIVDTVICPRGEYPIDVLCKQKSRTQAAKLWCNVIYRVGLLELNDVILDQMEPLVKQHHVSSFLWVGLVHLPKAYELRLYLLSPWSVIDLTEHFVYVMFKVEEKVHLSILHAAGSANCPILLTSPTGLHSVEETAKSRRRVPPVHAFVTIAPSSLLPSATNGMQRSSQFLGPLATGDISSISSDQAGTNHPKGSARLGAIGQRLVAVWEASVPTGWLDASGFVRVVSTNAARYTGQYPNKGRISPGSDADLVLWPSDSLTQPGTGRPAMVLLRGMIMAREGKLADRSMNVGPCITIDGIPQDVTDPEPLGEVLACEPFPMTVYSTVLATDRLRRRYQASMDNDTWSMGALQNEVNAPVKSTPSTEPSGTKSSTQPTASPTLVTNSQQTPENLSGVRMVHGHRDLHASGFSLSGK